MAGVRLHHPSLFDCLYVVELTTPFANGLPKDCPQCLRSHANKSIHLRLDANGDCFVTPGVWETIRREAFGAGLEPQNTVDNPPEQKVGAVDLDKLYVLDHPLNKSLTAAPSYKPGRTKYESQARMTKILKQLFPKGEIDG